MPIESLSCTGCGSTQVQEVKPNTYFCAHCEKVFKRVDPSTVTVTHRPDFCSCGSGNPIFAQCQVCRDDVVCRSCDIGYIGLLAVSSGFGPAWRVDGGKIVSLTA